MCTRCTIRENSIAPAQLKDTAMIPRLIASYPFGQSAVLPPISPNAWPATRNAKAEVPMAAARDLVMRNSGKNDKL